MFIELFLINSMAWSVVARLNILLIIVDDLRPALGCYGDDKAHTPNIDALAKESVIFTQAYAQQSLCAPSRNSFLTSRRPDTLQLYDFYSYWRNTVGNLTTLPEHLRNNGYTTMSVGKVFHPGISSNGSDDSPYSWSEKPFHPYTDRYKEAPVCRATENLLPARNLVCPVCVPCMPNGTLPDIEALNAARTFIHKHHEDSSPFFLAVGFQKPHIPLKYPQQYLKLHPLEKFNVPEHYRWPNNVSSVAYNPWTDLRKRDDIEELLLKFPWEKIPPDFAKTIIQSYYAAVTYIDDLIGMLMDQLRISGIRENTAVILISDHGWSLGEHAEWAKYSNYDVALRVPVLVSIPSVTFNPYVPSGRSDCPTFIAKKSKTTIDSSEHKAVDSLLTKFEATKRVEGNEQSQESNEKNEDTLINDYNRRNSSIWKKEQKNADKNENMKNIEDQNQDVVKRIENFSKLKRNETSKGKILSRCLHQIISKEDPCEQQAHINAEKSPNKLVLVMDEAQRNEGYGEHVTGLESLLKQIEAMMSEENRISIEGSSLEKLTESGAGRTLDIVETAGEEHNIHSNEMRKNSLNTGQTSEEWTEKLEGLIEQFENLLRSIETNSDKDSNIEKASPAMLDSPSMVPEDIPDSSNTGRKGVENLSTISRDIENTDKGYNKKELTSGELDNNFTKKQTVGQENNSRNLALFSERDDADAHDSVSESPREIAQIEGLDNKESQSDDESITNNHFRMEDTTVKWVTQFKVQTNKTKILKVGPENSKNVTVLKDKSIYRENSMNQGTSFESSDTSSGTQELIGGEKSIQDIIVPVEDLLSIKNMSNTRKQWLERIKHLQTNLANDENERKGENFGRIFDSSCKSQLENCKEDLTPENHDKRHENVIPERNLFTSQKIGSKQKEILAEEMPNDKMNNHDDKRNVEHLKDPRNGNSYKQILTSKPFSYRRTMKNSTINDEFGDVEDIQNVLSTDKSLASSGTINTTEKWEQRIKALRINRKIGDSVSNKANYHESVIDLDHGSSKGSQSNVTEKSTSDAQNATTLGTFKSIIKKFKNIFNEIVDCGKVITPPNEAATSSNSTDENFKGIDPLKKSCANVSAPNKKSKQCKIAGKKSMIDVDSKKSMKTDEDDKEVEVNKNLKQVDNEQMNRTVEVQQDFYNVTQKIAPFHVSCEKNEDRDNSECTSIPADMKCCHSEQRDKNFKNVTRKQNHECSTKPSQKETSTESAIRLFEMFKKLHSIKSNIDKGLKKIVLIKNKGSGPTKNLEIAELEIPREKSETESPPGMDTISILNLLMKSSREDTKKKHILRGPFKLKQGVTTNAIRKINENLYNRYISQSLEKNNVHGNRNPIYKVRLKSIPNFIHRNFQQQKLRQGKIAEDTVHHVVRRESLQNARAKDIARENIIAEKNHRNYAITAKSIPNLNQLADRDDLIRANAAGDVIFKERRNERRRNVKIIPGVRYTSSFHEDLLSHANTKVSKRPADVNVKRSHERKRHLLRKHHKKVHNLSKKIGGKQESLDKIYQSLEKDHEELMKDHEKLIKDHDKLDKMLREKLHRGQVRQSKSRKIQSIGWVPEYRLVKNRDEDTADLDKSKITYFNDKLLGFNPNEERTMDEKEVDEKRKLLDLDDMDEQEKTAWKSFHETQNVDHSKQKPQLSNFRMRFELNYLGKDNNHKHDQQVFGNKKRHLTETEYIDQFRARREKRDLHLADNMVQYKRSWPEHLENIGNVSRRKREEKEELLKNPRQNQNIPKRQKYITVDSMVELVDIFPMIAELAGFPIPICPGIGDHNADHALPNLCSEGVSLIPIIEATMSQKIITWKTAAFSQYPRPGMKPTLEPNSDEPRLKDITIMGYTIRTRKYRYTAWVRFANSAKKPDWSDIEAEELYDQDLEAGENMNLASIEAFQQIKDNLKTQLRLGWRHALPEQYKSDDQKMNEQFKSYE